MGAEEAQAQVMEARILSNQFRGSAPKYRKVFTRALESGVRPSDMRLYLTTVAVQSGKRDEADRLSRELLAEAPNDVRALLARAAVVLGGWRDDEHFPHDPALVEQARGLYREAIRLAPADAAANLGLANVHLSPVLEATEEAMDAIEAARVLHADSMIIPRVHARLLARRGEYTQARGKYDELIGWARTRRQRAELEEEQRAVEDPDWPRPLPEALRFH